MYFDGTVADIQLSYSRNERSGLAGSKHGCGAWSGRDILGICWFGIRQIGPSINA